MEIKHHIQIFQKTEENVTIPISHTSNPQPMAKVDTLSPENMIPQDYPSSYKWNIGMEIALSVATCIMCGGFAKYIVVCDTCGSAVCQQHYGQACAFCPDKKGRWSIQCKQLSEALETVVKSAQRMCTTKSRSEEVSSPVSMDRTPTMAMEIRRMAKYCTLKYGEGYMSIYVESVPSNLLHAILHALKQAGCIVLYDGLNGMLFISNSLDVAREDVEAVSPLTYGFTVEYTQTCNPTQEKVKLTPPIQRFFGAT